MPSIADVYAEVSPTLTAEGERRFTRALSRIDSSRAGVSIGQSLGKGMRVSMFQSVKGIAGPLAAAFAGIKVGGFLKNVIGQASDLSETISKTRVVFGRSAVGILAWSKISARSFGLSEQAALAAASQFGDMFHQLGFTQKQSAVTSKSLVKMAADLGSFHNVDPSDVLQRIGAALRGEYDSLQQLIPNINAARVEQEALRETHKKSAKDLTAAEKATATLTIVQRDGASAAGDFARTSGGLANQQRILSAQFANFKTSIGRIALPLVTRLFRFLNDTGAPALRSVLGFAKQVSQAFTAGLGGNISTNAGVLGYVGMLGQRTGEVWAYIRDTAVPGIVEVFGTVKGRIERALPSVDLSGIAKSFTVQARGWGAALIAGVKVGLETGDWSGLGETVGRGIVSAIGAATRFAKDFARKIGDLLGKVDWVGVGLAVGKQAVPFLIGLAAGFLSFDLLGTFKQVMAHWQDILIAALALWLTPSKFIGPIGRLLARIPLVGKLLEWSLLHMKRWVNAMAGVVGDAIAFIGRAFLIGFRRVFPGVGARFAEELGILPTRLGLVAIRVWDGAQRMVRGLAATIARNIGAVVAKIGELIARMLRPFVGAAGWLIRRGTELAGGLIRGILGRLDAAAQATGRVITAIRGRFLGAGIWLAHAGGEIISGLFAGIRAAMRGVGSVLSAVKDAIVGGLKRLFHIGSPSRVMAELGGYMITGLIKGLLTNSGALARTVKGIGGDITSIFGDIFGSFGGGQSAPAGAIRNMVQSLAAARGWTGAQWSALQSLIMGESGFNPNAKNPTSSAYGLFQFLDSTWGAAGGQKTSDPTAQTIMGLRYIADRYGDPVRAYSAWLSRTPHWYGAGGLITEPILGLGRSGRIYGFGERGVERVTPGSGPAPAAAPAAVTRTGPVAVIENFHAHDRADLQLLLAELEFRDRGAAGGFG